MKLKNIGKIDQFKKEAHKQEIFKILLTDKFKTYKGFKDNDKIDKVELTETNIYIGDKDNNFMEITYNYIIVKKYNTRSGKYIIFDIPYSNEDNLKYFYEFLEKPNKYIKRKTL